MSRLERIQNFVEKQCRQAIENGKEPGVEVREVSEALSIWYNDASVDLNKLVQMNILRRVGKRPIKFLLADTQIEENKKSPDCIYTYSNNTLPSGCTHSIHTDVFDSIIGTDGSLKSQIQIAKAAVSYPPFGLHTLIIGETGVGKSLLAEVMWQYAVSTNAFNKGDGSIPFVRFNCAEYADNPQLLLSELFGHAKGSFTGATEDKPGLVEKANGGILLLDEIHRLPSTGQELFFTLIDKGIYRRLRDTTERKAKLMIIGTTTEDISNVLLTTFKRRIPVIINIPSLSERPPKEKLSLISLFLSEEALRLNMPIWISGCALKILFNYKSKANIGDLKSAIQLCCAKSYLTFLSDNKKLKPVDSGNRNYALSINVYDLSQKLYTDMAESDESDEFYSNKIFNDGLLVKPGEKKFFINLFNTSESSIDLYEFLENQVESYKLNQLPYEKMEQLISGKLNDYYNKSIELLHLDNTGYNDNVSSFISCNILRLADEILKNAFIEFNRHYSKAVQTALALHLQQFLDRVKADQIIYNPDLKNLQKRFPKEISLLKRIHPLLVSRLGVPVPDDELGFIAMFLKQTLEEDFIPKIGLVIVAYGDNTAKSLAEFGKSFFSTDRIYSVDKPKNKSLDTVFEELCRMVKEANEGKGVLILSDMEAFIAMEKDIYISTGIQCKVMPHVSSLLVIEACKLVLTTDDDLYTIFESVAKIYFSQFASVYSCFFKNTDSFAYENLNNVSNNRNKAIITICATGVGSASKVKDILLERLPSAHMIDIIPVSILDDVQAIAKELGPRLKLIVGSMNPHVSSVPFLSTGAVFSAEGISRINTIVKGWGSDETEFINHHESMSRNELNEMFEKKLSLLAPSLDSSEVLYTINKLIHVLETQVYSEQLPVDAVGRIIMHTISMFDRLGKNSPMNLTGDDILVINQRQNYFDLLKNILETTCNGLISNIPESEVYYFMLSLPDRTNHDTV